MIHREPKGPSATKRTRQGQIPAVTSLVDVDSPDDFRYEGKPQNAAAAKNLGDTPWVTVDNPDDFE